MISAKEAFQKVMETAQKYGVETVGLEDAIGRVLSEDIMADRAFPPFDRVTMDGIAINYDSWSVDRGSLIVESIAPAGSPQVTLTDPRKCIEVMTGAVLPVGADTIIRYEDLKEGEGSFTVHVDNIIKGKNIHQKGSDHSNGELLLRKGLKIKAIDINILATVGKSNVEVYRRPKVVILSSGDELVAIDQKPLLHQIRMSNVYMLKARLKELGIDSDHKHINDDKLEIKNTISKLINMYDVILMSGGVSKGKFDYIPEVLENLGVQKIFHKVAQRPGKPLWFGKNKEVTVFAFPGNPVSTLSCFHKYCLPWLSKSIGESYSLSKVILKSSVTFKPDLTFFAQVKVSFENGNIYATPSKGNGSGDMVHPSQMDGFVELPKGKGVYETGEIYDFIPFHSIMK